MGSTQSTSTSKRKTGYKRIDQLNNILPNQSSSSDAVIVKDQCDVIYIHDAEAV